MSTPSRPRFGLLLPNQGVVFGATTAPELLELGAAAEAGGVFDTLYVGDNLLAKPRLESVTLLAALAARTSRVRLGTACMASFPLRHPIVLAAEWGALDTLSGGRSLLVACIGGGGDRTIRGRFDDEYAAFAIKPSERADRLVEGMQVLRTLWTDDPASHHGTFFRFDGIAVRPQPVQKPCPPIWIANNPHLFGEGHTLFTRATERVGRHADGWMTVQASPEQFRAGWQAVRAAATAAGRDADALGNCCYLDVNIGEPERANAEAKQFLDGYYSTDHTPERLERWGPHGPPEVVVERIRALAAAGVQELCVRFSSFDQAAQLKRFVDEVVPLL